MLKAPGTKRLKLKCDIPVLNFAFKFNLRRYKEGVPSQRVVQCDSLEAVAAAVASGKQPDVNIAQRCVADPLLVDGGRKASLHFYVVVTGVGSDGSVEAGLSKGFTLRTCPQPYYFGIVEDSEAEDPGSGVRRNGAHLTTRGDGGDLTRSRRREVATSEAGAYTRPPFSST